MALCTTCRLRDAIAAKRALRLRGTAGWKTQPATWNPAVQQQQQQQRARGENLPASTRRPLHHANATTIVGDLGGNNARSLAPSRTPGTKRSDSDLSANAPGRAGNVSTTCTARRSPRSILGLCVGGSDMDRDRGVVLGGFRPTPRMMAPQSLGARFGDGEIRGGENGRGTPDGSGVAVEDAVEEAKREGTGLESARSWGEDQVDSDRGETAEAEEYLKSLEMRLERDRRQAEAEGGQEFMTSAELNEDIQLLNDIRAGQTMDVRVEKEDAEDSAAEDEDEDLFHRAHPLTLANKFGTDPSTLQLPKDEFTERIIRELLGVSMKSITTTAQRVFGGVKLPYSTSTPRKAHPLEQKPIPLTASQRTMSKVEADVFMTTLMPGIYASVMSVLVETRRRLGTDWAESMVRKAYGGELRILDLGGAGTGVLAVRELLAAEWKRMHEDSLGGAGGTPPLGAAMVLTGSEALRHRAKTLIDNASFIPHIPDYTHTEEAKKRGKWDIVIAPHTLWPLNEDYIRNTYVQNLWSLLSSDGGVLLLLEKGVPRGFELIAGAREKLLRTRIDPQGPSEKVEEVNDSDVKREEAGIVDDEKEKGAIIAPCPNHAACPMYKPRGQAKLRRDTCHFSQRYIRPHFLQRILRAKDKNFEDVEFSYLSVIRGRDLREEKGLRQDTRATDAAFEGYENATDIQVPTAVSLPRAILPPLKRKGHVIMDFCTPGGTLERWTIPRSFSKQAFRDARKSDWGDMWALGAKTRIERSPKIRPHDVREESRRQAKSSREGESYFQTKLSRKEEPSASDTGVADDGYATGRPLMTSSENGRLRTKKIKGVRDKRDKRGDGGGRRRESDG